MKPTGELAEAVKAYETETIQHLHCSRLSRSLSCAFSLRFEDRLKNVNEAESMRNNTAKAQHGRED